MFEENFFPSPRPPGRLRYHGSKFSIANQGPTSRCRARDNDNRSLLCADHSGFFGPRATAKAGSISIRREHSGLAGWLQIPAPAKSLREAALSKLQEQQIE
jgi:hypothetical protein